MKTKSKSAAEEICELFSAYLKGAAYIEDVQFHVPKIITRHCGEPINHYLAGLRKGAEIAIKQQTGNPASLSHYMMCEQAILDYAATLTEVPNE